MKKVLYFLIGIIVLLLDQATKMVALLWCKEPYRLHDHVWCAVHLNRGISFGLFHRDHSQTFTLITIILILVTSGLLFYSYRRVAVGKTIWAEMLVIAGATSNLIDRVVHGGVVDFIECSYKEWIWPSFNLADSMIVVGILMMYVNAMRGK